MNLTTYTIAHSTKILTKKVKADVEKKSKAQIFLERVEKIDTILENKLIEQQQWRSLATSISANMDGERVQSSSPKSKLENAVVNCVAMEDEICECVDKLIEEKRKVTKVLESLYSPTEYKILHMRYIQYISLSDIADRLNREYTWVTTTHGRALKNVQKIIDRQ
jgi:DNA-directed RNA polymerase specialized sigma24 family protein